MVSESLVGTYLDAQGRESSIVSEEHGVLTLFAQRLQSSSSTSERSMVDETRQEAQLLMSLMFCSSPSLSEPPECEPLSSSDHSCDSDSSWSRKDLFTFTCPSLSLEKPGRATHTFQRRAAANSKAASRRSPDLMGRALTVDDRDAVRLSADAMARNVLHSFQKAMQWRIQAWMETLAATLAQKEHSLLQTTGATLSEVRNQLRASSEARLLLVLNGLCDNITAHSSTVKFDVQPQRVEKDDQEPAKKKHCTRRKADKNSIDGDHTVTHHVEMNCEVHLETPAGFAEIEIQAPGTIQGTFGKDDNTRPELKAVSLEVSTPILSAMMEKSSRTIVRTCVEQAMKTLQEAPAKNQEALASTANKEELSFIPKTAPPSQVDLSSPLASTTSEAFHSAANPAFVTPREGAAETHGGAAPTYDKILMPLSEELDHKSPRRISPTGGFFRGASPPCLGPRPTSAGCRVPLISPLAGDTQYHDVPDNGPSLPMLELVEAACRAASIPDRRSK